MGNIITSKDEYMEFITYLRSKDNVIIDHRNFFAGLSSGCRDIAERIEPLLKKIKMCPDSLEAYYKIAQDLFWYNGPKELKISCPFVYEEDVYDYLIGNGLTDDAALMYAKTIAGGAYKKECKKHNKSWSLECYGDIHNWAKAIHNMTTWDYLPNMFKSEYYLFSSIYHNIFSTMQDDKLYIP